MNTSFNQNRRSAVIQIANPGNGPKQTVACTIGGMEGKRLNLQAVERIAVSTPVSVEHNDAMFLGEVIACTQTAGGSWEIGIKVSQILTGLQSLMILRAQLIGEKVPQPAHHMSMSVYN